MLRIHQQSLFITEKLFTVRKARDFLNKKLVSLS